MTTKFNVLWIDDEYESFIDFSNTARLQFNLNLIGFRSREEGVEKFKENPDFYDAILLDADFYDNIEDTQEINVLGKTERQLRDIDSSHEVIVLTGRYNPDEPWIKNNFPSVFDKNDTSDGVFEAILKACNRRENSKLKIHFPNAYALTEDEYLGSNTKSRILDILRHASSIQPILDSQDEINEMRKILEAIFNKLVQVGVIPDEVASYGFNVQSKYLSGKDPDFKIIDGLVPRVVSENLRYLTLFVQDGSHSDGNILGLDDYVQNRGNDHVYKSLVFIMLDVLNWMKVFLDEKQNLTVYYTQNPSNSPDESEIFMRSDQNRITAIIVEIKVSEWGIALDKDTNKKYDIPKWLVGNFNLQINDLVSFNIEYNEGIKKIRKLEKL